MKKRNIKNFNLNKRSISNLSNKSTNNIKGGTIVTGLSCWSCISCPTLNCTEGVVCEPTIIVETVVETIEQTMSTVINK